MAAATDIIIIESPFLLYRIIKPWPAGIVVSISR